MNVLRDKATFTPDAPVKSPKYIYHATFVDGGGVWRDLIFRGDALENARSHALERGREVGMQLKFISRILKRNGEISLLTHRPFQPVPDFLAACFSR